MRDRLLALLDRCTEHLDEQGRRRAEHMLIRALDDKLDLGLEWQLATDLPSWPWRLVLRALDAPVELLELTPASRLIVDAHVASRGAT